MRREVRGAKGEVRVLEDRKKQSDKIMIQGDRNMIQVSGNMLNDLRCQDHGVRI